MDCSISVIKSGGGGIGGGEGDVEFLCLRIVLRRRTFMVIPLHGYSPLRRHNISHSPSITRASYPACSSVWRAQLRTAVRAIIPRGGRTAQSCSSRLLPESSVCHFRHDWRYPNQFVRPRIKASSALWGDEAIRIS